MKTKKTKIIILSSIVVCVVIVLGIFFFINNTGTNFFEDTITITDNGYLPKGVTFSDDVESASKKTGIKIQTSSNEDKANYLYIKEYNVDYIKKPFEVGYYFEYGTNNINVENLDEVLYITNLYPEKDFKKSAKTYYNQAIDFLGEPIDNMPYEDFLKKGLTRDGAIMTWIGEDGSAIEVKAFSDSFIDGKTTLSLYLRISSPEHFDRQHGSIVSSVIK